VDVLTEHPDILNIEAFVLYPAKENRQNYSSRRIQQPQMLMRVVYPTPDDGGDIQTGVGWADCFD